LTYAPINQNNLHLAQTRNKEIPQKIQAIFQDVPTFYPKVLEYPHDEPLAYSR
jgi:hypothetical protein